MKDRSQFVFMDPFDDYCCCPETMVDRGDGWHFPPEDGDPGFRCFQCSVCGSLWFKDDGADVYYTHSAKTCARRKYASGKRRRRTPK